MLSWSFLVNSLNLFACEWHILWTSKDLKKGDLRYYSLFWLPPFYLWTLLCCFGRSNLFIFKKPRSVLVISFVWYICTVFVCVYVNVCDAQQQGVQTTAHAPDTTGEAVWKASLHCKVQSWKGTCNKSVLSAPLNKIKLQLKVTLSLMLILCSVCEVLIHFLIHFI